MTTYCTAATTDAAINTMTSLSLDHDYIKDRTYEPHQKHQQKDYYTDDTTSDSTVTATTKDMGSLKNKRQVRNTINQDWLDEIERSFNDDTRDNAFDDFYDHQAIIQSYLEPNCIQQETQCSIPLPSHRQSKFSVLKSRVKRVFGLSTATACTNYSKRQSSLPMFHTTVANQTWNPSIDSICSSTITATSTSTVRPTTTDLISTRSTCSSTSSQKSYLYRNSCMSSSPFTKPHVAREQRGHSTISKLKNRFSRASSLCTLPVPSSNTTQIKGILKKQTLLPKYHASHYQQQRPISAIIETPSHQRQIKRWSTSRLSIHGVPSTPKKRYTVLSTMMMSTKKKDGDDDGRVRFNKFVDIHETYAKGDYDRTSDPDAVCTKLTASVAAQIKQELNHYKFHEMAVHDSSRIHTHFFS